MPGRMENRTRQVTEDITVPTRTKYVRGSHIAHISLYAQSGKTYRETGIRPS